MPRFRVPACGTNSFALLQQLALLELGSVKKELAFSGSQTCRSTTILIKVLLVSLGDVSISIAHLSEHVVQVIPIIDMVA